LKKKFNKEAYFKNVGLAKFITSLSLTVLLGFSPKLFAAVNADHHLLYMILTNLSLFVFVVNMALKGRTAKTIKLFQSIGLAIAFVVDAVGCIYHIDLMVVIAGQSFFLGVITPTNVLRSATENLVKDEIDLTLLHVHVVNMASFGQVLGIIISVMVAPYLDVYTGLLLTTFAYKVGFLIERFTNFTVLNDRVVCIRK